jgi:hypothetical protein
LIAYFFASIKLAFFFCARRIVMANGADELRSLLADAIGAATGAVQLAQSVKDWAITLCINDVLYISGLEIETNAPLTARVLADALQRRIWQDYGLDVGDLLDAESVRRATKKEALRIVGDRLGVRGGAADIAQAIKTEVREQLRAAAAGGDAELLAAMKVGQRAIDDAARAAVPKDSGSIKNTSEKAKKNRERQEKYRASHKRVWVAA